MNYKNLSDNRLFSRIQDGRLAKIIKLERNIFKPDSVKLTIIPSYASLYIQHSTFKKEYEPLELVAPLHLGISVQAGSNWLKAGNVTPQKVAGFTSRRIYLETDGSDNLEPYTYRLFSELFTAAKPVILEPIMDSGSVTAKPVIAPINIPSLSPKPIQSTSQPRLSIDDEIRAIHATIQKSVERLQRLERMRANERRLA